MGHAVPDEILQVRDPLRASDGRFVQYCMAQFHVFGRSYRFSRQWTLTENIPISGTFPVRQMITWVYRNLYGSGIFPSPDSYLCTCGHPVVAQLRLDPLYCGRPMVGNFSATLLEKVIVSNHLRTMVWHPYTFLSLRRTRLLRHKT